MFYAPPTYICFSFLSVIRIKEAFYQSECLFGGLDTVFQNCNVLYLQIIAVVGAIVRIWAELHLLTSDSDECLMQDQWPRSPVGTLLTPSGIIPGHPQKRSTRDVKLAD